MKLLSFIIHIFLYLLFIWVLSSNVHASESLRDIDSDISSLQWQKVELQSSWENFRNEYGGITDFIKKDLSPSEKISLWSLLNTYLEEIRKTNNTLELRKNFFQMISPYIDKEKYTLYETYKETWFRFEEERKEINDRLQERKEQREERTDLLKTYIADNALERRDRIQSRVEPLLRERLNVFTTNPWFQELSQERKILVFWRILSKIQEQHSILENTEPQTSVILDRIATYTVIESIMQEYINIWR